MSNYPPGAENDPRVPYNEVEQPYIICDVLASYTLSKCVKLEVNDYYYEDEETINTSDCDFYKAYEDQEYSPLELINKFKEYLIEELKKPGVNKHKINELILACSNWTVDECEVIEE